MKGTIWLRNGNDFVVFVPIGTNQYRMSTNRLCGNSSDETVSESEMSKEIDRLYSMGWTSFNVR